MTTPIEQKLWERAEKIYKNLIKSTLAVEQNTGLIEQALLETWNEAVDQCDNAVRDSIFVNDDLHDVRRVIQQDIRSLKSSNVGEKGGE